MATITKVNRLGIVEWDKKKFLALEVSSATRILWVERLERDGTVRLSVDEPVIPFLQTVVGCLEEDSNFFTEVKKACNIKDESLELTGINFVLHGVNFTVTKENAKQENESFAFTVLRDRNDSFEWYAFEHDCCDGGEG